MRKTVHKLFWAWDFDKEEKWLNEMAAKGLALVSVGFCRYDFEDCDPGEYRIRTEFMEKRPNSVEGTQYIAFLEDTGAEHIGNLMGWAYFRRKAAEGDFQLFSDNASRVKYLSRVIGFIAALSVCNLLIGAYNIFLYFLWDIPINLLGILNLLISAFALLGMSRLVKKRNKLKAEMKVFE